MPTAKLPNDFIRTLNPYSMISNANRSIKSVTLISEQYKIEKAHFCGNLKSLDLNISPPNVYGVLKELLMMIFFPLPVARSLICRSCATSSSLIDKRFQPLPQTDPCLVALYSPGYCKCKNQLYLPITFKFTVTALQVSHHDRRA